MALKHLGFFLLWLVSGEIRANCDLSLINFPERWREDFRQALAVQDPAAAELALQKSELDMRSSKMGIIYKALADEVVAQGLSSPAHVREALLNFYALAPDAKLELLENVAERIVNMLDTDVAIRDYPRLSQLAKSYGMKVADYMHFLSYWRRAYEEDPTLAELKYAILLALLTRAPETARQVSRERSLPYRLWNFLNRIKDSQRPPPLRKLSIVDIFEGKSAMGPEHQAHLATLSNAARDYYVRNYLLGFSESDISRFLLGSEASSLSATTSTLLLERAEAFRKLRTTAEPFLQRLRRRLALIEERDALSAQLHRARRADLTALDRDYIDKHLAQTESYSDRLSILESVKNLLNEYAVRFDAADFMEVFAKCMVIMKEELKWEADRLMLLNMLQEASLYVPLREEDKLRILAAGTTLLDDFDHMSLTERALATLRSPWGTEKVLRFSELEQAQARLEKEIAKVVSEEAEVLQEFRKVLSDLGFANLN
jgi:hypothetical protein